MKTAVFYFTGTGSSLVVAKKIAAGLEDAEFFSISSYDPAQFDSSRYRRVGFVYPNYYGTVPVPMSEFIEKLSLEKVTYLFALVSVGKVVGMSLADLEQQLNRRGKVLNYGNSLVYGSNYIVAFYYPFITLTGNSLSRQVSKSDAKIDTIISHIRECRTVPIPKQPGGTIFPTVVYGKELNNNRRSLDRFFATDSSCTGCGICAQVCPIHNITMNGKPRWSGNCVDCCACIQLCPKESITYKGKSLKAHRFIHPHTSVNEIIQFNKQKS